MTPRSLFSIILKVIGIFFLKDFLFYSVQLIVLPFTFSSGNIDLLNLLLAIIALVFYLLIIYILIFKTDYIINKLSLDKGYPEQVLNINIHRSVILSITMIILGGLIIIESMPALVQQIINYIQLKNDHIPHPKIDYIVLSGVKLFIGLLLIIYQNTIVNFIERKRKKVALANQEGL